MNVYELQLSLLSPRGFGGDDQIYLGGGGGMVVASMFPASRIVVRLMKCEYTRIWNNILLLRTLRYGFCK